MTEIKTFAGIPIRGYGSEPHHLNIEQKSKEELAEKFRTLLSLDSVEAVRWEQFTPYFNDGDPCYFSVYEPRFKLKDVDVQEEDSDYGDGFITTWDVALKGGQRHVYHYGNGYTPVGDTFPRHPDYDTIRSFCDIENGSYDNALVELFGDHARITVTRDGIDVDDYEHD